MVDEPTGRRTLEMEEPPDTEEEATLEEEPTDDTVLVVSDATELVLVPDELLPT